MSKIEKISFVSQALSLILLILLAIITEQIGINGLTILIILIMMSNPVAHLLKFNEGIVANKIYHIGVLMYSIIVTGTTSQIIIKHYSKCYCIQNNNELVSQLYNNLIFMIIPALIFFALSLILKKENHKYKSENNKYMYILLIVFFLICSFNNPSLISRVINISSSVFLFIVLRRPRLDTKDIKSPLNFLIILSIINVNPIAIFLLLSLYKNTK